MPARILVADDNAANLELMLYLLRAFGHDAHGCSDGLTAYERARAEPFDLVLSDILMPGIDGYELARRLTSEPETATIPIVAVTALAMDGDRRTVEAAGFCGYISKPIDPERFVRDVEAYLRAG